MCSLSNRMRFNITIILWVAVFLLTAFIIFSLFEDKNIALGISSILIALISIIIGISARKIGIESANANFLNALSKFEDRRLNLQFHPEKSRLIIISI